jgi:predicted PurR-regulated permease PerM
MTRILKIIAALTNELHDFLIKVSSYFGFDFNDKQLHFIIIAIIGMFIYFAVNKLFKAMSKYGISILSFIYTFTVLIVIVFAIEIQQKITRRGNMEFSDIVAGLWGFIVVFAIYIVILNFIRFTNKFIKKYMLKKNREKEYASRR